MEGKTNEEQEQRVEEVTGKSSLGEFYNHRPPPPHRTSTTPTSSYQHHPNHPHLILP